MILGSSLRSALVAGFLLTSSGLGAAEPFELGGLVVRPASEWELVREDARSGRLLRTRRGDGDTRIALQVRALDGALLVAGSLVSEVERQLEQVLATSGRDASIESLRPTSVDGAPAWRARVRWRSGDRELAQSLVVVAADRPVLVVAGCLPAAAASLEPALDEVLAAASVRRPPHLAAAWPVAAVAGVAAVVRSTRRRRRQR